MVIDHKNNRNQRTVIMHCAKKSKSKDPTDIGEILNEMVTDNARFVVKGLERGTQHADVGEKSEQKNDANKRYIIFGNLVNKIWHC